VWGKCYQYINGLFVVVGGRKADVSFLERGEIV